MPHAFPSPRTAALLACLAHAPFLACAHPPDTPAGRSATQAIERAALDAAPTAARAPATLAPDDVAAVAVRTSPMLEPMRHGALRDLALARASGQSEDPMLEARVAPLSAPGLVGAGPPLGAELMVSQKVSLSGRLDKESEAAAHDAAASALAVDDARHAVAREGRVLACDAWMAARGLELHDRHLAALAALKQTSAEKIAAGIGSVADALMVDGETATAETERLRFVADLDIARLHINALLGREADAALPAPPKLLASADVRSPARDDGSARGDVEAREHALLAARAREGARETAWLPDVALQAGYSSMWPDVEHQLMVGVAVELPVHLDRRSADLEAARADAHAVGAEKAALERAARTQTAAAERKRGLARALLAHHETIDLPLSERRRAEAESALATGAGSLLDVLSARIAEDDAALDVVEARAGLCRADAELLFAVRAPLPVEGAMAPGEDE
jgi:outer membrane protein TolC